MVAAERRQVDEKVKKIIELKNKVENICSYFDYYTHYILMVVVYCSWCSLL